VYNINALSYHTMLTISRDHWISNKFPLNKQSSVIIGGLDEVHEGKEKVGNGSDYLG
jgi:hypothetical protein